MKAIQHSSKESRRLYDPCSALQLVDESWLIHGCIARQLISASPPMISVGISHTVSEP